GNTPGANANGVKELVLAGMMLAAIDVVGGIEWVKASQEDENIAKAAEKEKKKFAGTELMGKKLGVIGLGAIGVKVANTAIHLGMEVYGYDPYLSVNAAWQLSGKVKHVINVDDIYAECDYITVHVPLLDSTKGMINKEAIAKMKDGVVLLNFARDLLANETDVLEGLESGRIARYVSDFPNPTTAGKKGCIVIPHLGASTEESEDNCAVMAVEEMMDYLANGNIRNSVNYPACDMGVCTQAGRVAIFHKNIANMITKFTAEFGDKGINITDMMNKSRGEYAYTMLDIESPAPEEAVKALEQIDGVFRVRVVKA
ncbi:MAG: phosphoglycerate dehydrogenase, partial [Acetatifactor sp.]|nr:phosphoglycerate dehydrogenase [Acetatifactor sp.]